jgi:tetratricopeptide (TPR) repeat protein
MAEDSATRPWTAQIQTRAAGRTQLEGTGFFVGRGLLLTCAHVVSGRDDAELIAVWSGKDWPCEVMATLPDPFPHGAALSDGMPDLALLRCGATNREALLLDPGAQVADKGDYSFYGFSEEADGEIVGHPLRCQLEGPIDFGPHWRLLKFNTGRVLKGMSGCAICQEQTERVVAVAKRRFTGDLSACYGIPAETVLAQLPAVEEAQRLVKLDVVARRAQHRTFPLPSPNPFFVARKAELAALVREHVDRKVTAILGPPGAGKSTLANEYVLNTCTEYDEVLWLDSRGIAEARRALVAIARQLGIELPAGPPTGPSELNWFVQAGQLLYSTIEHSVTADDKRWLVVLDDVNDIKLGHALLPQTKRARVLVTSTQNDLRALGARNPVWLGPLASDEARELVSARLGPAAEKVSVEAIAAQSDGSPGAVERNAATALEVGLSTGAFPQAAADIAVGLAAAGTDPVSGSLLRLASVLADEPLPLRFLFQPDSGISVRAVHALTSVSLARLDPVGDWVAIDPDVLKAVRQQLDEPERRRWQVRARHLLVSVLDAETHRPEKAELAPHLVSHALRLLDTWAVQEQVAGDVLLRACTARGLSMIGDQVAAEQLLDAWHAEIAQWGAARFGLRATAQYLFALAELKLQLRSPEAAETIINELERVLPLYDLEEGEGPSDLAEFVIQECAQLRGTIRVAQGRFEEALDLFQQSLSYFAHHPRGAVRAAYILEKLMDCLLRWGRVAKALELLPQVTEALRGTPTSAEAEARYELYFGIACVETAGNRLPDKIFQLANARSHLERALAIAERALPPINEVIASCCTNLAVVLRQSKAFNQGDDAGARHYLKRAVSIRSKLFGPASPKLAIPYLHLGSLQAEAGELQAAEASLLAVTRIPARPGDSVRHDALIELESVYRALENAEGLRAVQRALKAAEREAAQLPKRPPHPGESSRERNAAFILATLKSQKRVEPAEIAGEGETVQTMLSRGFKPEQFDRVITQLRNDLADGRLTAEAAIGLLRGLLASPAYLLALLEVVETRLAEVSPTMRGEFAVLKSVGLVEVGDYAQALEVSDQALGDAIIPPERRPELLNAKGRALFHLRDYARSAEAYQAGIAACGPDAPFLAQLYVNLGNAFLGDSRNRHRNIPAALIALQRGVDLATTPRLRVETRASLSTALIDSGEIKKARSILEEAWTIAQSEQGITDKARTAVLRNLGFVQLMDGDGETGIKTLEAAMARGLTHFGPCHPEMIELSRDVFGIYATAFAKPSVVTETALRMLQGAQHACGPTSLAAKKYTELVLDIADLVAQRQGNVKHVPKLRRLLAKHARQGLDETALKEAMRIVGD